MTLDPDRQVQESVHLLFQTFQRTGTIHKTLQHFREQGLLFPTRIAAGARKSELAWGPLSLSRAASILHNPWYAGAYVFGRGRWRKHPDGKSRHQRLPRDQWLVLIRDAHSGYIGWEQFEQIQRQLRVASKALGWQRSEGPPREGTALLQGRVVCGLCGARMHVQYNTRRNVSVPRARLV